LFWLFLFLLGALLILLVLVLPQLLSTLLLLLVLFLLLLPALLLLCLLLGMLLLLLVVVLLLLVGPILLLGFLLLIGFSLLLRCLLFRWVLFFVLLILLLMSKCSGSEKHKQNCCADDSNAFHESLPRYQLKPAKGMINCLLLTRERMARCCAFVKVSSLGAGMKQTEMSRKRRQWTPREDPNGSRIRFNDGWEKARNYLAPEMTSLGFRLLPASKPLGLFLKKSARDAIAAKARDSSRSRGAKEA
jgi:hypothetical protein